MEKEFEDYKNSIIENMKSVGTYKDEFFNKYKKALKENKLATPEQRSEFKASFDWDKMTVQDETVWNEIFTFLDN